MTFLVVAETFIPSGSTPGPPLSRPRGAQRPGPDRALLADRPDSRGSRPSPYLRGGRRAELRTSDGRARLADSVRLAVEEGRVTFVKLGQVLATRRDLLPGGFVTCSTAGACGSATVAPKRAGGHRPAPSGGPAPSSASRCPPPEPVGGLGGAEDPGRRSICLVPGYRALLIEPGELPGSVGKAPLPAGNCAHAS